ncbi:MAG: SDR family NAD(P)-dependent oxidoreductase [Treponema sp.]|nr:SDR family NAD(P)-dependent oxidoreductase [Treponema sp.]
MRRFKYYALVTGASSGIGLAISRELARRGYPLFMVSNEKEKLNEAATEIQAEYTVKIKILCMDLSQADSAQKLFDYCAENNIQIEILVNNAGIFFFNDVIDTPPFRMETMINLHVLTPAMLCRLFAKQMIDAQTEGYILNITSITSQMMMPGISLYGATKSFVRCFSRAMRHETLDRGVSITAISPGAVATNLYNLPPRYMKPGLGLGIIMKPERLARLALDKMFQRKAEYIPGGFNRFFTFLVKSLPGFFVRKIKKNVLPS